MEEDGLTNWNWGKWRQELVANPVFIREGTSVLDVIPGKLGDRWLVSTLGCLYLAKGFFYRVVPADQGFETALDIANPGTTTSTTLFFAFPLQECII